MTDSEKVTRELSEETKDRIVRLIVMNAAIRAKDDQDKHITSHNFVTKC